MFSENDLAFIRAFTEACEGDQLRQLVHSLCPTIYGACALSQDPFTRRWAEALHWLALLCADVHAWAELHSCSQRPVPYCAPAPVMQAMSWSRRGWCWHCLAVCARCGSSSSRRAEMPVQVMLASSEQCNVLRALPLPRFRWPTPLTGCPRAATSMC